MAMKILHASMALLMLVTAALQLNDPDPIYWVVTYLAVAAVGAAALFGRPLMTLSKIAIGLLLAGLLISLPGTIDYVASGDYASATLTMSDDKPYIESIREFGGLLVALVYLVVFEVVQKQGYRGTEVPRPGVAKA